MAISEFSSGPSRKLIGFVRKLPPDEARRVFKQRGYECYLLDAAALEKPGSFEVTDSVVISQEPAKPSRINRDLERFSFLLNYDCRLYVRFVPDLDS